MPKQKRESEIARRRRHASVFAALGDPVRLALVAALLSGGQRSIAQLAAGHDITRQAITKHLGVLAEVGIVRAVKVGRESRFEYQPAPIVELDAYLRDVTRSWDDALIRLKSFVETTA